MFVATRTTLSGFIHGSRAVAVSALAERRGRQACLQGMGVKAIVQTAVNRRHCSVIDNVAVFGSCKFSEIFAVYGSYNVAKGRQMKCVTVDGKRRASRGGIVRETCHCR